MILNVTPLLGDFGGRWGFYIFLQSPTFRRISPLSFVVGSCSLFLHFNSVLARLQAWGLARGTAISAGTWVKCSSVSSLFWSTKRRVWKNNFLKLEKFPFMKNYGITLIKGNYATSGQQKSLSSFWLFLHKISGKRELSWLGVIRESYCNNFPFLQSCILKWAERPRETRLVNCFCIWQ